MRSLTLKLIIAFLTISLTGAALAAIFIRFATLQEFNRLVSDRAQNDFINDITPYYRNNKSWRGLDAYMRQKQQLQPVPFGNPGIPQPPPPNQFSLVDTNNIAQLPLRQYRPGDRVPQAELQNGTPLQIDGLFVGMVLPTGISPGLDPRDVSYLDRTNQASFVSAIGALVVALLLSLFLARTLTRPVHELTSAIHAMAKGELKQQVTVRSKDELGELTRAFNQMSADLARANELRRQMTADIAHDLRTPLTVIGGYIESLSDGVLQPSPERFAVMHQEVQHLQHLVEDLRTLSLADAGELKLNLTRVSPQSLLEQTAAAFKHQAEQKKIALEVKADSNLPEIMVDQIRIAQVLGNLVSNALRFTTDGGQIILRARRQVDQMALSVEDDGAGIAPEALPFIFERFYRGDSSRQQNDGESGLGLAIAKSLVETHGGKITVKSDGIGRGSFFSVYLSI